MIAAAVDFRETLESGLPTGISVSEATLFVIWIHGYVSYGL